MLSALRYELHLELQTPLHHPESRKCLRVSVPPGPLNADAASWARKEDRVWKPISLDSWLQWKSYCLQNCTVTSWMWSAIHTPKVPPSDQAKAWTSSEIRLSFFWGFLLLFFCFFPHCLLCFPPFLLSGFSFGARPQQITFSWLLYMVSLLEEFLLRRTHRPCALEASGPFLAVQSRRPWAPRLYIKETVDLITRSNKATRLSLSWQMIETDLHLVLL